MKGICVDCGREGDFSIKKLTRHSLVGAHKPPFVLLCQSHHDDRHGVKHAKKKIPGKYTKGTKRQHKRK